MQMFIVNCSSYLANDSALLPDVISRGATVQILLALLGGTNGKKKKKAKCTTISGAGTNLFGFSEKPIAARTTGSRRLVRKLRTWSLPRGQ